MKVTCEKLEDSRVLLQIEVEPERSAKSIDQAYQRLVHRVSIPGFRKGKAPRQVVERIIGHEALVQEGIELLVPQLFREAVAETAIEPIGEPEVDVVQESPLVVKMTVPVRPAVELGAYQDIRVEREVVHVPVAQVDSVLQELREMHAEWTPAERPAAADDRVRMDITAKVRGAPVLYNSEGKPILENETGEAVIDQKDAEYNLALGSPVPVKGFAEELVGLSADDDKHFEINFPADYPDQKLANKAVIFHVKILDVKEKHLPELDDEFAKTVGDYESLDALREAMKANLERRAEREAQERLEEQVLNVASDRATVELPEALIGRETERLAQQAERRLRQSNVSMEEYLRATKKSTDDLRADYRTDAIANLRRYFILEEIARVEDISVAAEEVDAEIGKIAEALGERGAKTAATFREPRGREDLADELRHRKALERLVALASSGSSSSQEPVPSSGEPEPAASDGDVSPSEASEAQ